MKNLNQAFLKDYNDWTKSKLNELEPIKFLCIHCNSELSDIWKSCPNCKKHNYIKNSNFISYLLYYLLCFILGIGLLSIFETAYIKVSPQYMLLFPIIIIAVTYSSVKPYINKRNLSDSYGSLANTFCSNYKQDINFVKQAIFCYSQSIAEIKSDGNFANKYQNFDKAYNLFSYLKDNKSIFQSDFFIFREILFSYYFIIISLQPHEKFQSNRINGKLQSLALNNAHNDFFNIFFKHFKLNIPFINELIENFKYCSPTTSNYLSSIVNPENKIINQTIEKQDLEEFYPIEIIKENEDVYEISKTKIVIVYECSQEMFNLVRWRLVPYINNLLNNEFLIKLKYSKYESSSLYLIKNEMVISPEERFHYPNEISDYIKICESIITKYRTKKDFTTSN